MRSHGRDVAAPGTRVPILKKVWATWKRIGQFIGDLIARVVLSVFYFTLFVPFAAGVRLFGDPLGMKVKIPRGGWTCSPFSGRPARKRPRARFADLKAATCGQICGCIPALWDTA